MKTELRAVLYGLSGMIIVLGLLYLVGYRISGPGLGNGPGMARGMPGSRRGGMDPNMMQGGGGGGQGRMMAQGGPGSGQGGGQGQPGSRRGQGGGGGGAQPGAQNAAVLLPLKVGTDSIPVWVNGKQSASFVGKDLTDHVQDVTVATPEGPRKGWSVPGMFKYLKVENVKEAVVIDASGKKQTVSAQQLNDPQTIALFTYNEKGQLMLISGPKVRGAGRGTVSLDQVKQMVAGRKDLLSVTGVMKLEIKS